MWKTSSYNVEIESLPNGDCLVWNTRTSALALIDNEIISLLRKGNTFGPEDISEVYRTDFRLMSEKGFIVKSDVDECSILEARERVNRYRSTNLSLTIAPTMKCNMACPYCFEKDAVKSGLMSQETQKALIAFVRQSLKGKKSFSVTWYGGEPLLGISVIRSLSAAFKSICEEYSIKYSAAIITNGVLLTQDVARILSEECCVDYTQITVDGNPATHNLRRKLKSGQDSFDTIVGNIDSAIAFIPIHIRMNVDKNNVNDVVGLIKSFRKNKPSWRKRVTFGPAPVTSSHGKERSPEIYSREEFAEAFAESFLADLFDPKQGSKSNQYPHVKQGTCSACGPTTYVVDPDGNLYKCWDVIGMPEQIVGNVFIGPKTNSVHAQWLTLDVPVECRQCKYLPVCRGGCPYERMCSGNKPACHQVVFKSKHVLKKIYEEYIEKSASRS